MELLAVILILGIISLITIPIINNIINGIKKGAFETSTNKIVNVIRDTCELEKLKGETMTGAYTFTNGEVTPSLNIKGGLPTAGTATVDSICNVTLNVTNDEFTATKASTDDRVTVVDGNHLGEIPITYALYSNGTPVYFDPVTGSTCTAESAISTTGTKTGCMKWYAFNDSSTSSTLNLILDHNTTALVAWNSTGSNVSGPTNILMQLQADTNSWSGVPTRTDSYNLNNGTANYTINYDNYKARLITAAEVAIISGNSDFSEKTTLTSGWFYLDTHHRTQIITTAGGSKFSWLFDYAYDCTSYGCNINDDSTHGYWTSTSCASNTDSAWDVGGYGGLSFTQVGIVNFMGIRPVITISKSSILQMND